MPALSRESSGNQKKRPGSGGIGDRFFDLDNDDKVKEVPQGHSVEER